MTSAEPELAADETANEKARWIQPQVTAFDVGDAEASDGPGPDGGLAS